jgi:hypothetical protein
MGNMRGLARMRRFREQAVDRVEYAIFAARLKMVDWLYGPEPATEADREWQRERLCMGSGPTRPVRRAPQLSLAARTHQISSPATREGP